MDVSLITCTGFRSEAFALCRRWVSRFRLDGLKVEWIVVDDDPEMNPTDAGWGVLLMESDLCGVTPMSGVGELNHCTMPINFSTGLSEATGSLVVVIEDDDWYSPTYVRDLWDVYKSDKARLIGISTACYYHVGNRTYRGRYSDRYASFCRTAFDRSLSSRVDQVAETCHKEKSIGLDFELWHLVTDPSDRILLPRPKACISIKGMPGRPGAGSLHEKAFDNEDPDLSVLRSWIGADYKNYARFENV